MQMQIQMVQAKVQPCKKHTILGNHHFYLRRIYDATPKYDRSSENTTHSLVRSNGQPMDPGNGAIRICRRAEWQDVRAASAFALSDELGSKQKEIPASLCCLNRPRPDPKSVLLFLALQRSSLSRPLVMLRSTELSEPSILSFACVPCRNPCLYTVFI